MDSRPNIVVWKDLFGVLSPEGKRETDELFGSAARALANPGKALSLGKTKGIFGGSRRYLRHLLKRLRTRNRLRQFGEQSSGAARCNTLINVEERPPVRMGVIPSDQRHKFIEAEAADIQSVYTKLVFFQLSKLAQGAFLPENRNSAHGG